MSAKKGSREELESLKLIEVERASGRLVLTLAEKGWAYCGAQLAFGTAPPGCPSKFSKLLPTRAVLRGHPCQLLWKEV